MTPSFPRCIPWRRHEASFVLAGLGSVLFGAGIALSCLPDLQAAAEPDSPSFVPPGCGDGFLDSDAGEQCDPGDAGDAGVPGCTRACAIDCPTDSGFLDIASGHCYFRLPNREPFTDAVRHCEEKMAHVVTFASEDELRAVLASRIASGATYFWVGLLRDATGAYASVTDEPGWMPRVRCPGCFAHGARKDDAGLDRLPGAEEGDQACVVSATSEVFPWAQAACSGAGSYLTLCEREVAGARVEPCNGPFCVSVPKSRTLGKRYYYFPEPVVASAAAQTCGQFNRGRLVVFESNDEREQLLRELSRADFFGGPAEFWIGLSRKVTGRGVAASPWVWEDGAELGATGREIPWGDLEPKASGSARAYASYSAGRYDTQLSHAQDSVRELPFVCQYYP